MTIDELRQSVLALDAAEAKYFLLHFCDVLDKEKVNDDDPLITQANAVVKGINEVFKSKTKKEMTAAITSLYLSYEGLYQTSQVGSYSKKIQRSVIHLLGFITGLVSGILNFFIIPIAAIHHNWGNNTAKDVLRYFIIGFGSGCSIGMRWAEDFENRRHRQMFHVIDGVMNSIKGLEKITGFDEEKSPEDSMFQKKYYQILNELFEKDEQKKEKFLREQHKYQLVGINAKFGSVNLQGLIGHHLALVFTIDGRDPIIIELDGVKENDPPEDKADPLTSQFSIQDPAQLETGRTCSGEKLIQMMALDRLLQQHMPADKVMPWGIYKPGDSDCHTHIDTLLASVGEPLSTLTRYTEKENDHWLSKYIGGSLHRYSVFPEKPIFRKTADETPSVQEVDVPHARPSTGATGR